MKKIHLPIFILLISLLTITACSKNKESNNKQSGNQNQAQEQSQERQMPDWNENFEQANLSDLAISQQVLVMGAENSDGSISANQIMIGNNETDFENMFTFRRPTSTSETNDAQPSAGWQGRMPNIDSGQRPDFEQFQNMNDEEREQMRQEMTARREQNGGTIPGRADGGMTRLTGEIIDKDETMITLKLKDSGSKLIFYSSETKVFKAKDQALLSS